MKTLQKTPRIITTHKTSSKDAALEKVKILRTLQSGWDKKVISQLLTETKKTRMSW